MEGNTNAPEFLTKTYEMVNDQSTDHVVSWSPGGASFVIWKKVEFIEHILPMFFNHSNFSSFYRQLNKYGFTKINKFRWEFASSNFIREQPQLLRKIVKRPKAHNPSVTELNHLKEEAERLRKEKKTLEFKLEKLEKQKQSYKEEILRLKMKYPETEDSGKGLDLKDDEKKRKCNLSGKKSNIFGDIIKGKVKLPEIDLNSLPYSDVVEDPMSSRFKDSSPSTDK